MMEKGTDAHVAAEYNALVSYSNALVMQRFTLIGLFLPSVGLIAGKDIKVAESVLLIFITIALWGMELRNRSLLLTLSKRGIDIEKKHFKHESQPYQTFYWRQNPIKDDSYKDVAVPKRDKSWIFFKDIGWKWISHSRALDLLFLSVFLYGVWKFIVS